MIKIYQISKINIQNYYKYIFDKYFGHGYFCGYNNGNGYGFGDGYGDGFGFDNGDGSSYPPKTLIKDYKND